MTMIPLNTDFKDLMIKTFSASEAEKILFAIDHKESETSIRFNIDKGAEFLDSIPLEKVKHCPLGRYVSDRPSFTADPLFHAGVYYVQESSSMILYQIKDFLGDKPMVALDMCASPGGKSTLLYDILPNGSVLVSNEVVPNRASILKENIQKWGGCNNIVTSAYPQKWEVLDEMFDFVLVDAPCSGEGMFRKDIESRNQWTKESPYICSQRQKEILSSSYRLLKEGGLLVYSTCTYNREENENILEYIIEELGAESISLPETPEDAIKSDMTEYHAYRFMPHISRGEGLFFALVRKTKASGSSHTYKQKNRRQNNIKPNKEVVSFCQSLLVIDNMKIVQDVDGSIYAMTDAVYDIYTHISNGGIKVLTKGIEVGVLKGKDIVPSTSLAMSRCLSESQKLFDVVDISKNDALMFLRGEAITLPTDVSRGFVLIAYKGVLLGFVKNIGNRVNNLYPNNWRIQKPIGELIGLNTLF